MRMEGSPSSEARKVENVKSWPEKKRFRREFIDFELSLKTLLGKDPKRSREEFPVKKRVQAPKNGQREAATTRLTMQELDIVTKRVS